MPPVLAARQKSPPETAAEGKFLTVRQVEIKEKSKMVSQIVPTDMLVGRYNNSNSFKRYSVVSLSVCLCVSHYWCPEVNVPFLRDDKWPNFPFADPRVNSMLTEKCFVDYRALQLFQEFALLTMHRVKMISR